MLNAERIDYTIRVSQFEGPLDLLLALIEKAELDITTIALAHVADQYLQHVRAMPAPDAGQMSAFIVLASRLLVIKSRALLPHVPTTPDERDDSIDLVWSFDAMVHVGPDDFRSYLQHIARVLKPGGRAVLHHANRWHGTLWLAGMRRFGPRATLLYRALSIGLQERIDGWRSPVSARRVRRYATEAGLQIVAQCQRWGAENRYGVPRFNDRVTILCKPART